MNGRGETALLVRATSGCMASIRSAYFSFTTLRLSFCVGVSSLSSGSSSCNQAELLDRLHASELRVHALDLGAHQSAAPSDSAGGSPPPAPTTEPASPSAPESSPAASSASSPRSAPLRGRLPGAVPRGLRLYRGRLPHTDRTFLKEAQRSGAGVTAGPFRPLRRSIPRG